METDIVAAKTGAVSDAAAYTDSKVAPILTKNTSQDSTLASHTSTLASHTSTLAAHTTAIDALEAGAGSGGGGGTGGGIAPLSSDAVGRPLIGARVGAGSINTIPDSQYFNETYSLETAMKAQVDIVNWYRGIGPTSAADFTATVKPYLLANPGKRCLYVFEMDKNNSQFLQEMEDENGIYPFLVATLNAIKNSGVADRVYLAPFHEGNGGGGTPGSIGAYEWHAYDTNTGQLYTPDPDSFKEGTPYGSTIRLNTVTKYKQAFQAFVTLSRQLGVPSKIVQWYLAANSSDSVLVDGIARMDMGALYAGDAYVDIIGLSYYNRSMDPRPQYSDTWPEPGANGLREFYAAFEGMTSRDLWICETGCAPTNQYGDQGKWYADLVKLVASNELPRISGMVMFMQDTRKFDGAGGAHSAGLNMKLDSDPATASAKKKLLGKAINAARRPTKINAVPQLRRNLLPPTVANLTTTAGWDNTVGVTLAVGPQYGDDLDVGVNGMHITKPAFTSGDDKTSYTAYRRMAKENMDYVPNDPYVMSFTALAAYDGFRVEAGIRQDGGAAYSIGDELVLSTIPQDFVVPLSGASDDPALTHWRMMNFSFGNNTNGSATWFRIYNLSFSRGTDAQPNIERLLMPKVTTETGGVTDITWNCETANIYDVTLTQNYNLRAPTGVPYDGQEITLRVTQDGTGGRTLNLHSDFYSGSAPITLAVGPGAKTVFKFHYAGRWGLVSNYAWDL